MFFLSGLIWVNSFDPWVDHLTRSIIGSDFKTILLIILIFYTILFYFITMLELKKKFNRKVSKMDPSDGTLLHTAGQLLAHESHRPHLISLIVKSFSFKGLTFQRHHLLISLPVPLISCGLTFHLRALAR